MIRRPVAVNPIASTACCSRPAANGRSAAAIRSSGCAAAGATLAHASNAQAILSAR
jgi:uncharacterized protein YfaQ (DUF2300 family)